MSTRGFAHVITQCFTVCTLCCIFVGMLCKVILLSGWTGQSGMKYSHSQEDTPFVRTQTVLTYVISSDIQYTAFHKTVAQIRAYPVRGRESN